MTQLHVVGYPEGLFFYTYTEAVEPNAIYDTLADIDVVRFFNEFQAMWTEMSLYVPIRDIHSGLVRGYKQSQIPARHVPGAMVLYQDVIPLFIALPEAEAAQVFRLGDDVLTLFSLLRLADRMVRKLHFLPGFSSIPIHVADTPCKSVWKPWFKDEEDSRYLQQIAMAAPSSLCCFTQKDAGIWYTQSDEDIVRNIFESMTDALIRHTALNSVPEVEWIKRAKRLSFRDTNRQLGIHPWFQSLFTKTGSLKAAHTDVSSLRHVVTNWNEQIQSNPRRLQLGMRLMPPGRNHSTWTLSFYLFSQEHRDIWLSFDELNPVMHIPDDVDVNEKAFVNLASQLIKRAARHFYVLRDAVKGPVPCSITLRPKDVWYFLNHAALSLMEDGVRIDVPKWWTKKKHAKLQIAVEPKKKNASYFGLDALMDFDVSVSIDGEPQTLSELERILEQELPLIQIRDEYVDVSELNLQKLRDLLTSFSVATSFADAMVIEQELRQLVGDDEEALSFNYPPAFESFLEGHADGEVPLPEGLQATLRPYQEQGVRWMYNALRLGFGACLADDMGLGKTIQVIALILALRSSETFETDAPVLVGCPTSLVGNWQQEIARFAPQLRVYAHQGPLRAKTMDEFQHRARHCDVLITTYPLFARDKEFLLANTYPLVALDEAQHIKNAETQQAKVIYQIQANRRLALTGTPIENRLTELWSIFHFLNPGFLGSQKSFQKQFSDPIEQDRDEHKLTALQSLVRPFILRRTKLDRAIVPDLPQKLEQTVVCHLSAMQAAMYQQTVDDVMNEIDTADAMRRRGLILGTLTRLKQICDHPALLHNVEDDEVGKLAKLKPLLADAVQHCEPVLIFTQYLRMGQLLCTWIADNFSIQPLYLHGNVKRADRDEMVRSFQRGNHPVFILSLRAGGVGLNLTQAKHVVHYDRWWNPAVENQATDRAYRIGQTADVTVHKFVTSGTLEERIDDMLRTKQGLADDVLQSPEMSITELSTSALHDLFALRNHAIIR